MKIVLLNVEQAQSIYRSQMVRDFPESELKPFASVQGMCCWIILLFYRSTAAAVWARRC